METSEGTGRMAQQTMGGLQQAGSERFKGQVASNKAKKAEELDQAKHKETVDAFKGIHGNAATTDR